MSSVECHILGFEEQDILPFTFRHYATFCDRIILHDGGSTDRSRAIAHEYGVEVRDFITDGVNDALFKRLKETCWKGTQADWVITVDADEFFYAPEGWFSTLGSYEANSVAVVKPHGFEMFSDTMPSADAGQIYDQIKHGALDQKWYAKPVMFRPALIRELIFSAGCHTCWATLNDGTKISDPQVTTHPPAYLLHYHQIGGIDRITTRYAGQQSRHSKVNVLNRWGNYSPPRDHAEEKRKFILTNISRVIT